MAVVSKISSLAIASVNKVSGLAKSSMAKLIGIVNTLFPDDNAVAKSITTGTGQAVYITDSDGDYTFDHNDAFSVSFWIKVGWNVSINTTIHLFASADVSAGSANNDSFRIWYYEPHNRVYAEWRHHSNHKCQNFWLFHNNYGVYATAYAAAGLGGTYWNSSNRGNANSDGYTLITITRGTANTGANSNLKFYWNATDCGTGYYSSANGKTDGNNVGTPSMGNNDKQITLGSQAWGSFLQSGNNNETKFNGVTIWDKVLSSSEVTELYNSGTPMDVSTHSAYSSNCKGWWNFESDGSNEVSGGPAFTINGNSNIEAK